MMSLAIKSGAQQPRWVILFCLAGISLFGCTRKPPEVRVTPSPAPLTDSQGQVPVIALYRGPCFIACSAYSLEIYSSGRVIYSEEVPGQPSEPQIGWITIDQVQELLGVFADSEHVFEVPTYRADGDYVTPDWNAIATVVEQENLHARQIHLCFWASDVRKCAGLSPTDDTVALLAQQIDQLTGSAKWTTP